MLDHILGRPSVKFRKYQVFAVVFVWSAYLARGNPHGPPIIRRISTALSSRITAFQTVVLTMLYLYVTRNTAHIAGLESPEPLANMYARSFFRATWITTALDAGFWTAMRVRPKWARDIMSMLFSVYYLFCAEQADTVSRKVRGCLTLEHLRVAWNKPNTPYLRFLTKMLRPRLMRYPPRALRIPRPKNSSYTEPIHAWLYFDGPISALKQHDKIVLDIPGGGFVAMDPRCHDDKLMAWSAKTGLPVLSLDYKKAPEHPYPYALNECYDAYYMLVVTRGRCIGLSGEFEPHIIMSGDSAGGNLATGLTCMLIQSGGTESRRWHGERQLPLPEALVLIYPALDMNIGNWMTDEQMALIRDRRTRRTNQGVMRQKSHDYYKLTSTPYASDEEDDAAGGAGSNSLYRNTTRSRRRSSDAPATEATHDTRRHSKTDSAEVTEAAVAAAMNGKPTPLKTRIAMSSMISFFNDRILAPEMMRSMIILYVGPHHRPDFSTDFLLSPLLAPENLLAQFPKVFILTGERDPLVDDTVIFAGRLRQAKYAQWQERRELGLLPNPDEPFHALDHVEVNLIPGISHGFLQFVSVFPQGWRYIHRAAGWMREVFAKIDHDAYLGAEKGRARGRHTHEPHAHPSAGSVDEEREDRPLEMRASISSLNGSPPRTNGNGVNGTHTLSNSAKQPSTLKGSSASRKGKKGPKLVRVNSYEDRNAMLERQKSLVSLASEDDLLSRRMIGVAGGLLGDGSESP